MATLDDFTRADEDLEASSDWTLQDGTAGSLKVVSNLLRTTGKSAWHSYRWNTDFGPDASVIAKRNYFSNMIQPEILCVRVVDKSNWVGHGYYGTGAAGRRLSKCVSGTITDLISGQGVSGEWIKVVAEGDQIQLWEGGTGATPSWTQVSTDQTITDHETEASQGFAGYSAGFYIDIWDDFEAVSLAETPTSTGGRFIPGIGYVSGYNPGIIPGAGYAEGAEVADGAISVEIPKSNLTLTSYAPTVTAISADPITTEIPKHDLTLTSYAPTVLANVTTEIPKHDLTLTSYAPTVLAGITVEIPKSNLTLTSYAPTVSANVGVEIPKSNLTLTSHVPTVTAYAGVTTIIPKSALTLTSYAPTVLANVSTTIPKSNLTLTSYAPSVTAGTTTTIPKSNLTLTSHAPVVTVSNRQLVTIPKHDISLTSYAPTVTISSEVNAIIPKHDLILTSYAPSVQNGDIITVIESRVYTIQAENRVRTVLAENRVKTI